MTEMQRIMVETIYDNTVFKSSVANSLEKSKSDIAIEELSSLLELRSHLYSDKDMFTLIRFLDTLGFDFNQVYVKNKVSNTGEIVYTIGFVNNSSSVDVHIEYDKNVIHAGILVDMPVEND